MSESERGPSKSHNHRVVPESVIIIEAPGVLLLLLLLTGEQLWVNGLVTGGQFGQE